KRKQTSLGSGFLIDRDGFILTNNHVVEHADQAGGEVMVTLYDKRQFRAKVIGKDPKMDVALLQIREKDHQAPGDLHPVPLGDSDGTRIAESVFAVGNPFGLQHTVTLGIVSAKNRTIGQGPFDNFLQTDASINPGNSGGPLFNLKGEVVGINTMIFSQTGQSSGLGFAIPVNEAKKLLSDLKRYGRVPRPWLGILGDRVTPQLQAYYHLHSPGGVLIENLVEGAPADTAGVVQGDVILSIDGTLTNEPVDIERALAKHRPTETAKIELQRGRRKLNVSAHLQELPPKLENLPQGII
ncbi:MAG: S1C family serine protease, partial [Bdellovibrionota bacterium]